MLTYSQLSFWEKDTYFNDLDIVIVGAGIVGYSSAIELKQKFPNKKILIIERGYLPTGASTKNAGFTCFGSGSEILDDLDVLAEDEVVRLIQERYQGLEILLERCGKHQINYIPTGSHEIFTESRSDKLIFEKVMDHQKLLNNLVASATGIKDNYDIASNQFGFENIFRLIKNKGEGQIDTGKMMTRLHQIAVSKGILTLFGTPFQSFQHVSDGLLKITTDHGAFLAKKLIFATNGLSARLLPGLDLKPARAQVMITRPLENVPTGTFHYEQGYYYFRSVGKRILIGGGRNLDFEGETSEEFENTELITNKLKQLLYEVILPHEKFTIEQSWSGIMGVGKNRSPIVKYIDDQKSVIAAVRLGGMGVALGSKIGQKVSNLIKE